MGAGNLIRKINEELYWDMEGDGSLTTTVHWRFATNNSIGICYRLQDISLLNCCAVRYPGTVVDRVMEVWF